MNESSELDRVTPKDMMGKVTLRENPGFVDDQQEDQSEESEEEDFPEDSCEYPGILPCQGRRHGLYPGVGSLQMLLIWNSPHPFKRDRSQENTLFIFSIYSMIVRVTYLEILFFNVVKWKLYEGCQLR